MRAYSICPPHSLGPLRIQLVPSMNAAPAGFLSPWHGTTAALAPSQPHDMDTMQHIGVTAFY